MASGATRDPESCREVKRQGRLTEKPNQAGRVGQADRNRKEASSMMLNVMSSSESIDHIRIVTKTGLRERQNVREA